MPKKLNNFLSFFKGKPTVKGQIKLQDKKIIITLELSLEKSITNQLEGFESAIISHINTIKNENSRPNF